MSWAHGKDDKIHTMPIKRGDINRLRPGSVFFVQSDLQTERQKLRIYAIFANTDDDVYVREPLPFSHVQFALNWLDIITNFRILLLSIMLKKLMQDPTIGAYSSVRDLVRGFDTKVLRSAFKV